MRGPYIIEFRAEFSSIEGAFANHELTLMMNSCAHAYMHALEHIILCVCINIYVYIYIYIYYVQTHFMVLSFSHTRICRQLNVNSS